MTKRNILMIIAVAVGAVLVTGGIATASPATGKTSIIPIVMKDPGCHWFSVDGKTLTKYSTSHATVFRNMDEAPLVFKARNFSEKVPVGKTISLTAPGVYHIMMVGQASDDNHLRFVLK